MVGYQKNDSLSANQKLIAGCISGAVTRFLTQPLDVIKLRTQLQNKKETGTQERIFFRTTRSIFKEEGLRAFWHGHNLGQIHSVLAVSSQFYVYEVATSYLANHTSQKKNTAIFQFLCGIFAGCCSAALVCPLEVIRVRQMIVKQQYGGILSGAHKVYRSGGILAFYEGLLASLLQFGPTTGISFAVFRSVQPMMLHYLAPVDCSGKKCDHAIANAHRPENLLLASTVAGSAAGFFSKSITYPFDLAKRRLQIATHYEDKKIRTPSTSRHLVKCTNLVDCIIDTVKAEGLHGLYRGWKVTIYKSQLTSIILFTSYESLCYSLREHNETQIKK